MTRTHFTCFSFVVAAALAGCSSSHDVLSTRDAGPRSSGEDGGPGPEEDAGDGCPVVPGEAIDCHRFITDVEGTYCCEQASVQQECVDGAWRCPDGTFEQSSCDTLSGDGITGCSFCQPMDALTYAVAERCADTPEYRWGWDGRACRAVGTGCGFSECRGADCGALYDTLDACVSARAPCGAGACERQEVRLEPSDPVPCDDTGATTWSWNGWACQRFVGCNAMDEQCGGADCGARYETRDACESARSGCIDACDATDATLTSCDDIARNETFFVWDGHDCSVRRACRDAPECEGAECDDVFETRDACRAAFARCAGPVETDGLTCNLSEDALIQAALHLGACGVASPNEVIGGFFELGLATPNRSPSPGYVPSCAVVQCGSVGVGGGCDGVRACLDALRGDACEPSSLTQCVGTEVHECDREGALVPRGDCARVSGTCAMESTSDGRPIAYCDTPGNPSYVGAQTWCDGDDLIVGIGGESVRLSCPAHLPGTTCRTIRYAGEFPGEVCGYPDATCSEYLTTSVSCDADRAILCVGGRERRVDCVAEGFAGCVEGTGCVQ